MSGKVILRLMYGVVLLVGLIAALSQTVRTDPTAQELTERAYRPVDLVFNRYLPMRSDLRLRGVALPDQVAANAPLTFYLSWQLAYPPAHELSIVYRLTTPDGQEVIAAFDKIPPDYWTTTGSITRHTLNIPPDVPTGAYRITINARIRDGDLGTHPIGDVTIPPP